MVSYFEEEEEEEEEFRFFDAHDTIASVCSISEPDDDFWGSTDFQYDVWAMAPKSVHQRKKNFLKLMGLSSDNQIPDDNAVNEVVEDRITKTSGAVLRTAIKEDEEEGCSSDSGCSEIQDSNGEKGGKLLETVSGQMMQKVVNRPIKVADTMAKMANRVKGQFFGSFKSMADSFKSREIGSPRWANKVQRVRVYQNKKRLKELSAVFTGQDIRAHQGAILTMKFSLDGRYLASAGEDAVVRVWQVVEDERSNDIDIPDVDPSCLYFTVNSLSELAPLMAEKQKISKMKSLKKSKNSACVIFPPKVFRILEKPVHEFHGHKGDVLDLSWSKDNFLLSSSVDETVRLWGIGSDRCLKVFPHSNYVTCVQFHPVDENHFISGSIDGKVRIWSISGRQVVDWIDIQEIVTAVAYSPNGKGGIIGSMTGSCSFFSLSGNRFQLEASVSLNHKKKSLCKRIIGFQFFPEDPGKVMVTCADSNVRILHGTNVIGKFRGQRNAGKPFCASFTSDGKHIVSASEDSNVYVWNCHNDRKGNPLMQQNTVRSYECFSAGASVALPWSGLKTQTNTFSLGQEYFLDSVPKASATWPEEKLPSFSPLDSISSPLCKSRYKFFTSSCQSSYNCHTWGMVIVTAGWDGRIRSFLNYGLPVIV